MEIEIMMFQVYTRRRLEPAFFFYFSLASETGRRQQTSCFCGAMNKILERFFFFLGTMLF